MQHLSSGVVVKVFVDNLKVFTGSKEEGIKVAHADMDQFLVNSIMSYKGDRYKRNSIPFLVKYEDGDLCWVPWHEDIIKPQAFEKFTRSRSEINLLLEVQTQEKAIRARRKKEKFCMCYIHQTEENL
jgi:hypothetical protein